MMALRCMSLGSFESGCRICRKHAWHPQHSGVTIHGSKALARNDCEELVMNL